MQLIDLLIVLPCVKSCLVFTTHHDCSVELNHLGPKPFCAFLPPSWVWRKVGGGGEELPASQTIEH